MAKATKNDKPSKAKTAKPKAERKLCLCGCGKPVGRPRSQFLPGHDAKLKSILIKVEKGKLKESDIPEAARKLLVPCKCCGQLMLPHESGMGPVCRTGKCMCKVRAEAKATKKAKPVVSEADDAKKGKVKAKPAKESKVGDDIEEIS